VSLSHSAVLYTVSIVSIIIVNGNNIEHGKRSNKLEKKNTIYNMIFCFIISFGPAIPEKGKWKLESLRQQQRLTGHYDSLHMRDIIINLIINLNKG
jgi:hypothetical protein